MTDLHVTPGTCHHICNPFAVLQSIYVAHTSSSLLMASCIVRCFVVDIRTPLSWLHDFPPFAARCFNAFSRCGVLLLGLQRTADHALPLPLPSLLRPRRTPHPP